jgi:NADPH:quinone reductase-like Zn-dependent oxidoreductase
LSIVATATTPEVLEYTDVPDPKLSQNSVLVRVRAAALNPAHRHDQRVPRRFEYGSLFRICLTA